MWNTGSVWHSKQRLHGAGEQWEGLGQEGMDEQTSIALHYTGPLSIETLVQILN